MGIRPCILKTGIILDDSDGEARWHTIKVTNLVQSKMSLVPGNTGAVTYRYHVSSHFGGLPNELGQLPCVNEPMCSQIFGPGFSTSCEQLVKVVLILGDRRRGSHATYMRVEDLELAKDRVPE